MLDKKCVHCKFCVITDQDNGYCCYSPPTVASANSSSFPVVKISSWWCSKYIRHWRRWWSYKKIA